MNRFGDIAGCISIIEKVIPWQPWAYPWGEEIVAETIRHASKILLAWALVIIEAL